MKVWSTQLNSNLMPLFASAAGISDEPDHAGVVELCRRMTGVLSIKYAEVVALLAAVEMPRGFMHVRIFDEADRQEFVSSFSKTGKAVRPSMIATLIMIHERFLAGEWVQTSPMFGNPHEARGVLDLMVRFRPRPQPLQLFDVD